jgi:chemotaxis protein methyltransferase CheR
MKELELTRTSGVPSLKREDFDYCVELLFRKAGVRLDSSKLTLADARLSSLARSRGLENLESLLKELRAKPGATLEDEVAESLLTNETSFFRDQIPFQTLQEVILPELSAQGVEEVALWSAACSTGQEPYSLALLLQHLRESRPELRFRIEASDLSSASLRRAEQGRYSRLEVNRGLSTGTLLRFFRQAGLDWELNPELRALVRFRRLSLLGAWPEDLKDLDVVFLRNVLI